MTEKLAIVLFTYASSVDSPRHEYAKITLESLIKHVKFSKQVRLHVADDGSPDECIRALHNMLMFKSDWEFGHTSSERRGYGASFNLATQYLHDDCKYLLMVEDDWELKRRLDIDTLAQVLDTGELNCIRLGYLGWTQELSGTLIHTMDMSFLKFDEESAEPHVWAGHPRLETRDFQRKVGLWPEGQDPGTTEFTVAKRKESREKVGWPLDIGINSSQQHASLFAHVGAVQARSDQGAAIT